MTLQQRIDALKQLQAMRVEMVENRKAAMDAVVALKDREIANLEAQLPQEMPALKVAQ